MRAVQPNNTNSQDRQFLDIVQQRLQDMIERRSRKTIYYMNSGDKNFLPFYKRNL